MKLLNLFQGTINVVEGWMERGGGSGENLKEDEEEEVVVIIIQHYNMNRKHEKCCDQ